MWYIDTVNYYWETEKRSASMDYKIDESQISYGKWKKPYLQACTYDSFIRLYHWYDILGNSK